MSQVLREVDMGGPGLARGMRPNEMDLRKASASQVPLGVNMCGPGLARSMRPSEMGLWKARAGDWAARLTHVSDRAVWSIYRLVCPDAGRRKSNALAEGGGIM